MSKWLKKEILLAVEIVFICKILIGAMDGNIIGIAGGDHAAQVIDANINDIECGL